MTEFLLARDVLPCEPSGAAGMPGGVTLVGAAKLLLWRLRERPGPAEDLAAILSARMTPLGPGTPRAEQRLRSKVTLLRTIERVFHSSVFLRD